MAYKLLTSKGYRNAKVLKEGIPGWAARGYPVTGRRTGRIEHRPYPPAVLELERRLDRARGSAGLPPSLPPGTW